MEELTSESEPPDSQRIYFSQGIKSAETNQKADFPIYFTKMHGCGNDFIIIDELAANKPLREEQKKELYLLCNRNFGVGADQILLLEHSLTADARMRVIERDGSESDMCGNGIRCVARYLGERLNISGPIKIETRAGLKIVERIMNLFKVDMGTPTVLGERNYLFEDRNIQSYLINTGEPHLVIFTENIDEPDFLRIAKFIRNSEEFINEGVNVNIAKIIDSNHLQIRTFERGVENETLSCGTGATASGVISILKHALGSPINVETRGGPMLVDFSSSEAFLLGPAEFVFDSVTCSAKGVLPHPFLELQLKPLT